MRRGELGECGGKLYGKRNDKFLPNNVVFLFMLLLGPVVSDYSAQRSVLRPPSVHCTFFALGERGSSVIRWDHTE